MAYVDYAEVKRLADIVQVANWLGVELKGNRSFCPVNQGDPRELVVTPEKGFAACFGCKKPLFGKRGGDMLWLTAHVKGITTQQAATLIMKTFHGYEPAQKGLPETGLTDLEYEHDQVQALGLTVERAQQLGIGWRNRGVLGKGVHIPVRDASGKPMGYVRFNPQLDPALKVANSLLK